VHVLCFCVQACMCVWLHLSATSVPPTTTNTHTHPNPPQLYQAYQEQYRLAQGKLQQMAKGKQFDFPEPPIFGRFELFATRVLKLVEMFTTLDQFVALSQHRLEGMEGVIAQFHAIVKAREVCWWLWVLGGKGRCITSQSCLSTPTPHSQPNTHINTRTRNTQPNRTSAGSATICWTNTTPSSTGTTPSSTRASPSWRRRCRGSSTRWASVCVYGWLGGWVVGGWVGGCACFFVVCSLFRSISHLRIAPRVRSCSYSSFSSSHHLSTHPHNERHHPTTQSFENITSIEHSLQLLRRFQAVLQRESLKSDLDSKLTLIFQNYGMELEQVSRASVCLCVCMCVRFTPSECICLGVRAWYVQQSKLHRHEMKIEDPHSCKQHQTSPPPHTHTLNHSTNHQFRYSSSTGSRCTTHRCPATRRPSLATSPGRATSTRHVAFCCSVV
jgi:hypothetical protein